MFYWRILNASYRFLFLKGFQNIFKWTWPTARDGRLSRALTSHGSVGTGTKICGTLYNFTYTCRDSQDCLRDERAGWNVRGTVSHGCPAGQAGLGQKMTGLSLPVPCPSLPKATMNYVKFSFIFGFGFVFVTFLHLTPLRSNCGSNWSEGRGKIKSETRNYFALICRDMHGYDMLK